MTPGEALAFAPFVLAAAAGGVSWWKHRVPVSEHVDRALGSAPAAGAPDTIPYGLALHGDPADQDDPR